MGSELTSPRSPRIKAARKLARRPFRAAERRFLAEGPQAVREALRRPGTLAELFVTVAAAERNADLVAAADSAGVPVQTVSGEVMASLAQTVTPQGVAAVCRFVDVPLADALAGRPALVAVLVNVRDPGNAGTVLRAADAAGAGAVILSEASVDLYNGKCVRASAGSLFHVPVVDEVAAREAIDAVRGGGLRPLAADASGERDLDVEFDAGRLAAPTAWVFGNEAWGLTAEVKSLCDATVRVPIYGRAESLNLATAAAVCLYASARAQRGAPGATRRDKGGQGSLYRRAGAGNG